MNTALKRDRLENILQACRSLRIGVVGDFALDGYWYADMTRSELSREAPLYNHPVVRETYSAGGAANVAANLATLGVGEVRAFAVFGEDWRGTLLSQILSQAGVQLDSILTQPEWNTPFFGKVVLCGWQTQQEGSRVDFVNPCSLSGDPELAFIRQIENSLPNLDGLIVADYLVEGGVVGPQITQALNRMARENPGVIFTADSRTRIDQFQSMVIKPNEVEVANAFLSGREPDSVDAQEITRLGTKIQNKTGRPVYITQGEKGALLCGPSEAIRIEALPVPPPLDTVGAGDTFVAGLTAGLAASASPLEAGQFATLAAAVIVQKLGMTGTASPDEILNAFDQYCGSND